MSFSVVRNFIFALDDKDFLSILDGASFYNRTVTVKKHYYNTLFGTISRYVDVSKKQDKVKLALIIKKLILERLGSVSRTSFVRFFMARTFHSKRDDIIDKIRSMATQFEKVVRKQNVAKTMSEPTTSLHKWITKNRKVFKSVTSLYLKKNKVLSTPVPDLRSKLPAKFGGVRYQYVSQRNAFYVNPDQSFDDQCTSYVAVYFTWLFSVCNQSTSFNDMLPHINRFLKRVNLEEIDPDSESTSDDQENDSSVLSVEDMEVSSQHDALEEENSQDENPSDNNMLE